MTSLTVPANPGQRRSLIAVAALIGPPRGRLWYQIDYNHRVAWVPADEVTVSAP